MNFKIAFYFPFMDFGLVVGNWKEFSDQFITLILLSRYYLSFLKHEWATLLQKIQEDKGICKFVYQRHSGNHYDRLGMSTNRAVDEFIFLENSFYLFHRAQWRESGKFYFSKVERQYSNNFPCFLHLHLAEILYAI